MRRLPWWLWVLALVLAFGGCGRGCLWGPGMMMAPGMGRSFGRFGPLPAMVALGVGAVVLGVGLWWLLERTFWHKYFPTQTPPPPMKTPSGAVPPPPPPKAVSPTAEGGKESPGPEGPA